MGTLIAYATKYGCTESCAKALAEKLDGPVELVRLKQGLAVDLSDCERVIIGGSIYMGRVQKEAADFCAANLDQLKHKKLGLFTCCMREGEEAQGQLSSAFPKELLDLAQAKDYFGGEFIFSKMKTMDRFIAKKVSKASEDVSAIQHHRIEKFAETMNNS